jgi:hypothetical protein
MLSAECYGLLGNHTHIFGIGTKQDAFYKLTVLKNPTDLLGLCSSLVAEHIGSGVCTPADLALPVLYMRAFDWQFGEH